MFAYAANNPVHYIDPDGRSPLTFTSFNKVAKRIIKKAVKAATKKAAAKIALCTADGFFPIGDTISAVWTLYDIYEAIRDEINTDSVIKIPSKIKEEDQSNNEITMYHYTNVPPDKWVGPLAPGNYLTPEGNYSGEEAANKLALPKDKNGNDRIPTYKYTFKVKRGEYATAPNSLPGNIVAPLEDKPGGGIEFVNKIPLLPINCESIER